MDSEEIQMAKAMAVLMHIDTDGMTDEEIKNAVAEKLEEIIPEELKARLSGKGECRRTEINGFPALEVPVGFGNIKSVNLPMGHLMFMASFLSELHDKCVDFYREDEDNAKDRFNSPVELFGNLISGILVNVAKYAEENEDFMEEMAASDSLIGVASGRKVSHHDSPMFG